MSKRENQNNSSSLLPNQVIDMIRSKLKEYKSTIENSKQLEKRAENEMKLKEIMGHDSLIARIFT